MGGTESGGLDRRLVAVMFTDMVGYTALMQADERLAVDKRDRYVRALETHHDAFGGTIVQRLGDGSLSMFPSSLAAVLAAVEIQRELAPQLVPLRIGVHVGEVIVEPERLTGDAVNIAARIESFAVPGGVMLSDSAYDQIKNRSDIGVVGLGRFRLKNVGRPLELYAVSADGVVVPDPIAMEGKGERYASLPSNLPDPVEPLLGRAMDIAGLAEQVRVHRVVTITGPGGVGKTRVLIELGRVLAPEFLDGVALVSLVEVTDPAGFVPALARSLDVKESEERTLGDGVVSLIGDRKALLLLDNFEQIVSAAPDVAGLIASCPQLRIVTTSRTPLRIAAEREYQLAPLELPPSSDDPTESILAYPSVALFVERAITTRGSFKLTPENAAAVSGVCRRLDGLPLALELAAARLRILPPEALLERLDHALDVLASGSRDVNQRHRTLRATIDWSHSLLTEAEQRLFRRMAVFTGGCTLADVESVCGEPGEGCLDELESLVDKALVQVLQGERFRMLQTIEEFARERLQSAGEAEDISRRHARRYAEVACQIRDGIEGTDQIGSVERGIAEEGNLQTALDTLLAAAASGDEFATEQGMQLSGDLWMYWHVRGKNVTAADYARAFLAASVNGAPTAGRAGALITAGLTSWMLGQYQRSSDEWAEAYRIAYKIGGEREQCIAGLMRALALLFLDPPAGVRWAEEAIEASRAVGFIWAEGFAATFAGILLAATGDPGAAQARHNEALEIQRRLGDQEGAGVSLGGLAELASARGDTETAIDLYRRSLAAFEAIGDRAEEARVLSETAWTHLANHDPVLAHETFLESVRAHTDVGSVRGVGLSLIGLAATEAVEHRPEIAVQIAAAAEVYAGQEGIAVLYDEDAPGRAYLDRAEASLSADEVTRAKEAGRRLSIKEALDLARTPQTAMQ
jgi:predicted ATPase/class 3 adenylate cyclase